MKRAILILVCLSMLCLNGLAKSHVHKTKMAKSVTVSGCITEGVECMVLESLNGAQKYSVVKNSKLKVGSAYRITGTLNDISTCMQGMPTLAPKKITQLKTHCPKKG